MILSDIQCVSAKQILFCRTGEMLGESHMSIYTKNGDKGTTNLVHTKNVSKSDDRIQLEGTIDELSSHIGVLKTMIEDGEILRFLEKIQENLMKIADGVADPYNRDYKINDDKTELLEEGGFGQNQ